MYLKGLDKSVYLCIPSALRCWIYMHRNALASVGMAPAKAGEPAKEKTQVRTIRHLGGDASLIIPLSVGGWDDGEDLRKSSCVPYEEQ